MGDCLALCDGQTHGRVIRPLTRKWCFFYIRTADFERNLQSLKQFASINRAGTQNKLLSNLICFQGLFLEVLTLGSKKYIMLDVYMPKKISNIECTRSSIVSHKYKLTGHLSSALKN
jgi:hypothetical protein